MTKVNGSIVVVDDATIESRYSGEIEISGNFEFESIRDMIASNYEPQDIFDDLDLETWAENNGYEKIDEEDDDD